MSSADDKRPAAERMREQLLHDFANSGEGRAEFADRLTTLLSSHQPTSDFSALPKATLQLLRPQMARRADVGLPNRVLWRVLPALLPLPFVIIYAAYVLQAIYTPIAAVFSPDVAGYVAGVHVMLLSLLFGATYAAIPVVLARKDIAPRSCVPVPQG